MPDPISAILIGAGQRGADSYGPYALRHPDQLCFVAVAEPDAERRERFAARHQIPPENTFASWEPLLALPRLGQAALVCTPDQMHTAPALSAMRQGYDVLLEKPMATTEAECRLLAATAKETGRQLHICHVLRYTKHFQTMRQIIQSGDLGELVDVAHRENVSYWHMAHSFVRGNWAKTARSSPMILAKCCHDLDILPWMLGRNCERLSSVGSLIHFHPANAPPGAPEYCLDGCPAAQSCPYFAPFIYIDLLPLLRTAAATVAGLPRLVVETHMRFPGLIRILGGLVPVLKQLSQYRAWPLPAVANDPTPENLVAALRRGPYGRCVYHCDNDAVDHQVVMMEFAGRPSVTLTMHGHAHVEGRSTRIQGSRAELEAHFGTVGSWIEVRQHRSGRRTRYRTGVLSQSGHGGGDEALMTAFVGSLQSGGAGALTLVDQSLESHLLAFAAEKARLERQVIEMAGYGENA